MELAADASFFIALNRDEAKTLFGLRDPDLAWEHMASLQANKQDTDELATIDGTQVFLQVLGCGETDPALAPLASMLTSGRPLCDEPTRKVTVIRPDVTQHVALAAANLSTETWNAWCSEHGADPTSTWEQLETLRKVFAAAASGQGCVVFTAGG